MKIDNSEYDQLFFDLLSEFQIKQKRSHNKKYSLVFPVIGSEYSKTFLMICGRATKGYFNEWTLKDLNTKKAGIIINSKEDSENDWATSQLDHFCSK